MGAGEAYEVCVSHLSMTEDVPKLNFTIGNRVGPELARRMMMNSLDHLRCGSCGLTQANEESDQRSLDDRADRESIDGRRPHCCPVVMLVLTYGQRDENIRVKEKGHSSSSASATSWEVMRRPTLTTGKPDRGSVVTTIGSSSRLRP